MQDRPSAPIDFDELERQLTPQASPKRPGNDDPLAELARVVGHDDLPGGAAARMAASDGRLSQSFDDFLRSAPGPAANAGERLLPLTDAPLAPHYGADGVPRAVHPQSPAPDQAFDDLFVSPSTTKDAALPTSYEAALAELGLRSDMRPEAEAVINEQHPGALAAAQDEAFGRFHLQADSPIAGSPPANAARAPAGSFDDMLAEFEAAMRDAGAERAAVPPPSLAPVPVPEAPAELQDHGGSTGYAAGAVPAAAGAVAAGDAMARPERGRRGLMLAAGVIGVAVIGVASLLALGTGPNSAGKDAPVIAAKPGAMKERPANPGGIDMPNQDKEVLQPRGADTRQGERVVPREEQPLDLTQAQRSAESQAQNGVRQIPGVSQITPNASAPAPAVPRPVASVPITISGPPPGSSQAAPIGMPSMSLPPQVSGLNPSFAQSVIPAAPTPPPSAPAAPVAPAAAPPAPPAAAPSASAAAAEPRRVRAVPIRPDEAAPSRAQAQPRVVPTPQQPAADTLASAAVDDANGPLRITPQVARPAAPRVAAVLPSPAVPTSTSSQPATTQTAPVAPAAPGASFSVQLAAEGSEDAARSKFNRIRSQHSSVLGNVNPVIRNAEVNGRSVYRLRVGDLSREEAVSLCDRLKADGGSCFVARN